MIKGELLLWHDLSQQRDGVASRGVREAHLRCCLPLRLLAKNAEELSIIVDQLAYDVDVSRWRIDHLHYAARVIHGLVLQR